MKGKAGHDPARTASTDDAMHVNGGSIDVPL